MQHVGTFISCLALLLVAAFCCFGFLATFEPLDNVAMVITFRLIYATIGSGAILFSAWLVARAFGSDIR